MSEERHFDDLTDDEKRKVLKDIADQLGIDDPTGASDDFGIDGEFTVRVLDDDGNEKRKETQSFKY